MRISFCKSETETESETPYLFNCLRSRLCFCCFCSCSCSCCPSLIPCFLRTKDSCANPLPLSHSHSQSQSQLGQGKLGALSVQQVNPKSCMKKKKPHPQVNPKGNVRWMDMLGKELAHIKEYEPSSESESLDEDDDDGNAPIRCICCIQ